MPSHTQKLEFGGLVQAGLLSESRLWDQLRNEQDSQARETLVLLNLDFAKMLAASAYAKRTHDDLEFADYFQFASVGLLEAIDRFDPQIGVKFSAYASKRINGSIINGLASASEKSRQIAVRTQIRRERLASIKADLLGTRNGGEQLADNSISLLGTLADIGVSIALGILLEGSGMIDAEAFGGDGYAESPEVEYFRKNSADNLSLALKAALQSIAANEREVLISHYINDLDFASVALRMKLSKGRISQLHRLGLTKLREALNPKIMQDIFA